MNLRAIEFKSDSLYLLDQRLLPAQENWILYTDWRDVVDAIKTMVVRGAPAIGVVAAYGMALAAKQGADRAEADAGLRASRPTAVNLFWALDRIANVQEFTFEAILKEAIAIDEEDLAMNQAMGNHGLSLIKKGARILTICNTGALATAGHGTALGIIRTAFEAHDGDIFVYSCETRPRQQGLRLTAWELMKEGIPFKSIVDGAAASLLSQGMADLVIVGADRIAANGDSANKIGTLSLAVAANHYGIPFYVAAPSSTIDAQIPDGSHIPIEERESSEITEIEGVRIAPENCPVWNPGFDVTPCDLISGIVTEAGIFTKPFRF